MSRFKPRLSAFLLGCLASLGSAAAQDVRRRESPQLDVAESGPLETVQAGYGGAYSLQAPTPVWVTLNHPLAPDGGGEALDLTLVARGGGDAPAEERVTLPPGSRKRVCLTILIEEHSDVLLDVLQDGELLTRQELGDLVSLDSERHLLILDGRPSEQQRGASSSLANPVLRFSTLAADSAPPEASCYQAFGAVLLRGVDLGTLGSDQREALLEHAVNGGTVLVAEVDAQRLTAATFRQQFGTPRREKLLNRMAEVWDLGLGRVVAFPDDVFEATRGGSERSSRLERRLGDLVGESAAGNVYPRVYDELVLPLLEGPGGPTRGLVVSFFALYFLLVGPVLAIVFRKASRRRLALVTAGLVAAFCLLAPLVAGVVRTSDGAAYQRTVLYVPVRGGAFEMGEVTVVSGGATSYKLGLRGPRLAATVFPAGLTKEPEWHSDQPGIWTRPRPPALRTWRGEDVEVELSMSPWGQQSVSVQVQAPLVQPLDAELVQGAQGLELSVTNTSGQTLHGAIVMEVGVRPDPYADYFVLGTLAPGAHRTVLLGGLGGRSESEKFWHEHLGVSEEWRTWRDVAGPPWREAAARYQILSRVDSLLSLESTDLETVPATLRVDEIQPLRRQARGFLGVEISDREEGSGVKVDRAIPGGPAARAGLLTGDVILFVDQEPVNSVADLRRVVGGREPGKQVTVEFRDAIGTSKRVDVVLVGRHMAPGEGQ